MFSFTTCRKFCCPLSTAVTDAQHLLTRYPLSLKPRHMAYGVAAATAFHFHAGCEVPFKVSSRPQENPEILRLLVETLIQVKNAVCQSP